MNTKLSSISNILEKSLDCTITMKSENILSLELSNNKTITLDFKQDYIRHLKDTDISNMITNFNLINLIKNNDYKIININEKGATPYRGNK